MQKLERRFQKMRQEGLSDLKVSAAPINGDTPEDIAREMNRIFDAIEAGHFKPFSFNDSKRRED